MNQKGKASPQGTLPGTDRGGATILLVPIGSPSRKVLSELRAALQERTGLTVSLSARPLGPGGEDRGSADVYIRGIFNSAHQSLSQLQRDALLQELRLTAENLATPAQQSRIVMAFSGRSGMEGRRLRQQFEADLKSWARRGSSTWPGWPGG